ncbi:tripartite tricarboxylate transporter permease [Alcaligenes endophyticus]|uniref:Tripartite tricarboxylate transporter permease n=1 Tax=Alcaligenes endophyticus TaxID=1929088 RepID=A0ABT8EHB5_9BURK|nr:tripartite tricarboxylate transporter permease [Alcaligenes endophyticus]MCX5589661.1 tripartite tricarboxylate transporter permease [Alcaligenes endophyticus]MDN4120675.1 tripartite tricarboxylate transporter permease [Alcaligenes endophyticus]
MLDNLILGFQTAFSWNYLIYAFVGVFLGNLIGVLPGIGALAAISMLLPVTYGLDPVGGLLMLAGLYYGTSFGGATTSILLNLPGTASHAVVCVDGHPMARQGRGGPAIFMAMFASFIGVMVGIILMMFFSPLLTDVAFLFGPAEYFALMVMGLLAASVLTTGSPLKGVASVVIGLLFGVVGTDVNSGVARFDFGIVELQDGLALVALAMGLFGISDVLANAGRIGEGTLIAKAVSSTSIRPAKGEMKQSMGAIARGSGIGSVLGILPGAGGTMASFMSYAIEKKVAKDPSRFGKGAIEGVAGPESANSSAAITAFIPTLTLGIPGDAVMALMLGAMMIHNITPGPQLMTEHPELFWGLLVSFWIGNVMLMILNIPLIGMWVKLLSVPYRLIFPVVLFLVAIGVYSSNNNLFDVYVVLGLGVFGYIAAVLGFQPAPLLLGYVLGPMLEEYFRRALLLSRGDFSTFFTRPLSGTFMAIVIMMLLFVLYKQLRSRALRARRHIV